MYRDTLMESKRQIGQQLKKKFDFFFILCAKEYLCLACTNYNSKKKRPKAV